MMTPTQMDLARHALGLPNRNHRSYRNHYVTGEGHADWLALVDAGMARRRKASVLTGGAGWFQLTRAGAEAALLPGERLDPEDFE